MDIAKGFQIEQPRILIPWGMSPEELISAFDGLDLRKVNKNYFVARCVSLQGLSHKLGFHFDLRPEVGIWYLEFFDNGCPDNESSFSTFQKHLEATFGVPTTVVSGEEGYLSYTWLLNGCLIEHHIKERFGPAETVRIERDRAPKA